MPYKNRDRQKEHSRNYQKQLREAKIFVDHIQNHLENKVITKYTLYPREVCCKICNKTMKQIVEEAKKIPKKIIKSYDKKRQQLSKEALEKLKKGIS